MVYQKKRIERKQYNKRNAYYPGIKKLPGYKKTLVARNLPRFGMPETYVCKLRFSTNIQIALSPFGNVATRTFRVNSLFDPDQALGGEQPRFYDQMAAVYGKYQVLGTKITVSGAAVDRPSGNRSPVQLFVLLSTDGSSTPNLSDYQESSYCKKTLLSTDAGAREVVHYCNPSKFLGYPNSYDDVLVSSFSGSPSSLAYFHIGAANLDFQTEDTGPQYLNVSMDFTARFTDPILPPQS